MPEIRLGNDTDRALAIWVEPWGEDYWMNPGERFAIAADTPEGEDDKPFEVVLHDQGVSVWVSFAYEATVRDQSGARIECGHQRPAP
ncbi:hypothetical protein [Streptomyces sp. NPDC127092]|uniref:hypothetical protein n=1 Tax=Streptomyces sp. NPDC127092 TaxID=3347135 RepID=UPI0036662488